MTPSHVVHTRTPRGEVRAPRLVTDSDVVAAVLEDAAHNPGGSAAGVVHVESEADVAGALALAHPVLAIGAQSSLTGGATPRGELVLAMDRLTELSLDGDVVVAGAGLILDDLQGRLARRDALYPPVPTYTGATVGGVVATNAAGPATFKYATTREWVDGLTIVLAAGDVLDIRRGQHHAHQDGYFDLVRPSGTTRVPIAPVPHPDVPKCSAGYPLSRGMDLVDLFVGAEGTLGVVTAVRLRTVTHPPAQCFALISLDDERDATALASALRDAAQRTWRTHDARGIDIAAIEHVDARAVALLREEGVDREFDVTLPPTTAALLFVVLDLAPGARSEQAWTDVAGALEPEAPDSPLGRFCRLLDTRGLLERTELAMPDAAARRSQLVAVREAVPLAVNRRIARARQDISPGLSKLAGDFIVPFDRFGEMVDACRAACAARDLDLAIWGHISDGNIHPNVLPRRPDDGDRGRAALLEAGRRVLALGGSPLAEHGVGRNPLKQEFLRILRGPAGLAAMRAVKQALDPHTRLAPGVLLATRKGGG